VYLIERGVIKLIRSEANGRELIAAFRGPGWLVGAAGVILEGPAELTAQCACESDLRPLGAEAFRRVHASDPTVAAWVQRMLAREVREQSKRAGQFLLRPAQRLELLLAALARYAHSGSGPKAGRIQFPIRHQELADAIGVRRETATRLLAAAERKNVIERRRGWIIRKK
jgi:CRP/FNR family transcriptional regulator